MKRIIILSGVRLLDLLSENGIFAYVFHRLITENINFADIYGENYAIHKEYGV